MCEVFSVPWKLDPVALKRLRLALKIDRSRASEMTGLAVFTIRRHETRRTAPRHLQISTARAYAKVYQCEVESFARWEDSSKAQDDRDQEVAVLDPIAPAVGELERRAQRERELRKDDAVTTPTGRYELLGPMVLRSITTACKLFEGQRFAASGTVGDQTYLPQPAAWRVKAEPGVGAMFTLHRKVARGLTVYATVITREPEHTRALLNCANQNRQASVIVKVVVFMPEAKKWAGFLMKDGKGLKPVPFAFIVEEVLG